MTTNAQIGFGAKFSCEDVAGNANYVLSVEVTDITPPASKLDAIDATHMQSPGGLREFIPGLIDAGECSITMAFDPQSATDVLLQAWQAAREKRSACITFGDGTKWTFSAIPTDYAIGAVTIDGKMTATLTAKLSGSKVVS